jgi:hypothetical protein
MRRAIEQGRPFRPASSDAAATKTVVDQPPPTCLSRESYNLRREVGTEEPSWSRLRRAMMCLAALVGPSRTATRD